MGADGAIACPRCGRSFVGQLALDVHRRHRGSACGYVGDERRSGWRPGLYAARPRGA